uniref:Peptidase A2 domain-containing protein n=1 Tax=Micrurus carvalhoi TaxID=3147026 RepID=A0A2H6MZN8_9SAUR
MEVDTGSALSILSWKTLKDTVPGVRKKQLQPCQMTLKTIPVLRTGKFHIDFKQFQGQLPLVIINGDLPSLLGLDWFHALGLQITGINSIVNNNLPQLLEEFADIFEDTLGCYKGTPISLNLDPKIAPIRLKPRRVPLALKTKVDTQLDKLIAQGVLEPIDFAKWETPT